MTMICDDDDRQYRLNIVWVNGRPAIITIDSPDKDERLVNHLKKQFSNSDVKLVIAI